MLFCPSVKIFGAGMESTLLHLLRCCSVRLLRYLGLAWKVHFYSCYDVLLLRSLGLAWKVSIYSCYDAVLFDCWDLWGRHGKYPFTHITMLFCSFVKISGAGMESTCFLFCLHRKNQFGGRKMLFTALITGKTAIFILKVHFLPSQQQNNKNNL